MMQVDTMKYLVLLMTMANCRRFHILSFNVSNADTLARLCYRIFGESHWSCSNNGTFCRNMRLRVKIEIWRSFVSVSYSSTHCIVVTSWCWFGAGVADTVECWRAAFAVRMSANSLDYFLPGVLSADTKRRLDVSEEFVSYLQSKDTSLHCEEMDKLADGLANWVNSSSFKVLLLHWFGVHVV